MKNLKKPTIPLIITSQILYIPVIIIILKKNFFNFKSILFIMFFATLFSISHWTYTTSYFLFVVDNLLAKIAFFYTILKWHKLFRNKYAIAHFMTMILFYGLADISYKRGFTFWWLFHGLFHLFATIGISFFILIS